MAELHGYVTGLEVRKAGMSVALRVTISIPSGGEIEAVVSDPPTWLGFGARVACNLERIRTERGAMNVATGLRVSDRLPNAVEVELFVESIRETLDGHLILEGRRGDGGFFSYRLERGRLRAESMKTPFSAIALKIHQTVSDEVLAVLPLKIYRVLRRATELADKLVEKEDFSLSLNTCLESTEHGLASPR